VFRKSGSFSWEQGLEGQTTRLNGSYRVRHEGDEYGLELFVRGRPIVIPFEVNGTKRIVLKGNDTLWLIRR
jgi:hypothetical protein